MTKKSAVILLNGPDFSRIEFCDIISEKIFLVAADGGIKHISDMNIPVDIHAGDFDSSNTEDGALVSEKKSFPPDKDISDFSICLKIVIDRGYDDIIVFGGTGGRADHFISNYDTAVKYTQNGVRITFIGNSENIYFISRSTGFDFPVGSTVSVFSGSEKISDIELSGFRYQVKNRKLRRLNPVGLSNVVTDKKQDIRFEKGVLAVIYNKTSV